MVEGAYAQLAKALDLLPGGFPQTPSRVELRLLEKAFSKEEVELAGKMSRQHERCEDLATRWHGRTHGQRYAAEIAASQAGPGTGR